MFGGDDDVVSVTPEQIFAFFYLLINPSTQVTNSQKLCFTLLLFSQSMATTTSLDCEIHCFVVVVAVVFSLSKCEKGKTWGHLH